MAQNHSSAAANVRPVEPKNGVDGEIRAAHLLVKHRDSRRPSSWRQSNVTRSKEEAIELLKGYETQIKSGDTTLGDLAVSESDCTSARKRGDLGFFGKNKMQKEFEEAAFALQPGEMSGVVETASGVHLIQRLVVVYSQKSVYGHINLHQDTVTVSLIFMSQSSIISSVPDRHTRKLCPI